MNVEIFLEKVNPSPNLCSSRDLTPKLPKEGWGERQGVEETVLVHGLVVMEEKLVTNHTELLDGAAGHAAATAGEGLGVFP